MNTVGDRVPPQAVDVERIVLASMLLDTDACARALELTSEEFFYVTAHRHIYGAIHALTEAGSPVEVVSVSGQLDKAGVLDACGGPSYLGELVGDVASTVSGIDFYVRQLREKATARKLIVMCQQTMDACFSGDDVQRTLMRAEKGVYSASEVVVTSELVPAQQVASETMEQLERIYTKGATGVSTGLIRLDEETGGLQPSDLVVLAGRPSMGKTALALQMAMTAAVTGVQVAIFSLEMDRKQLMQRMFAMQGRLNLFLMRTGRLDPSDYARISLAAGPVSQLPILIDDNPDISTQQIRAKTRRLRNLGLIIIDYLQLMEGEGKTLREQVAMNSRSCKKIAKALNVPVLLLSQLSRANEAQGKIRRPRLSDLRESGNIEQDADLVLFTHRPEMYKKTDENEGQAEIIIGKQRNGPAGISIHVGFSKQYTLFHNAGDNPDEYDPTDIRRWGD